MSYVPPHSKNEIQSWSPLIATIECIYLKVLALGGGSIYIEINWQKTKLLAVSISYSDAFSMAWLDYSGRRKTTRSAVFSPSDLLFPRKECPQPEFGHPRTAATGIAGRADRDCTWLPLIGKGRYCGCVCGLHAKLVRHVLETGARDLPTPEKSYRCRGHHTWGDLLEARPWHCWGQLHVHRKRRRGRQ